jgi:hypothetical protein
MDNFMTNNGSAASAEAEAMRKVKRALAQMMSEVLLSSPTVPESEKQAIRCVSKMDEIRDRLSGVVEYLGKNIGTLHVEKASELLEYFTLVDHGIATFMEQQGIPATES